MLEKGSRFGQYPNSTPHEIKIHWVIFINTNTSVLYLSIINHVHSMTHLCSDFGTLGHIMVISLYHTYMSGRPPILRVLTNHRNHVNDQKVITYHLEFFPPPLQAHWSFSLGQVSDHQSTNRKHSQIWFRPQNRYLRTVPICRGRDPKTRARVEISRTCLTQRKNTTLAAVQICLNTAPAADVFFYCLNTLLTRRVQICWF